MAKLAPQGPFRALTNNGAPLAGGKLYTYEAGTSTPKTTYTTAAGTSANANPVILDANGYANVWLDSGAYKFILKDSADVTLWTIDDIQGEASTAFGAQVVTQSTNLALTNVYQNAIINCTAGLTISLLAAARAEEGFYFVVRNTGSGNVTIEPDGSETIDGASTATVRAGQSAIIYTNGTAWFTAFGVPTSIFVDSVQTTGSSGVVVKNSSGSAVMTIGPTNTTNVSIAGALTLGSPLAVAQGGTGATAAPAAFNNLNAGFFTNKILNGLTLSNNVSDATNDIDIAAGSAVSDDGTTLMTLASSYTKQLDVNWAVGTNQGGLDTGSIANGTYHVWLINRPDTGVTDVLFSTSATSPTMPTNYTKKKRIGSIMRISAAIVLFDQIGNRFRRRLRVMDVNLSTLSTSAANLTLSVPTGIVVLAECQTYLETGGVAAYVLFRSLGPNAETDTAPSATFQDVTVGGTNPAANNTLIMRRTNTSAQISYRSNTATINFLRLWTTAWVDETL